MADFPPKVRIKPVLQSPETPRPGEGRSIALDIAYAAGVDQAIEQPAESTIASAVVPTDPAEHQVKRVLPESPRFF
jgi:hypothetical protein